MLDSAKEQFKAGQGTKSVKGGVGGWFLFGEWGSGKYPTAR